MVCALLVVSMKYPCPATAEVAVEPSAVITACQDTAGIEPDAPNDTVDPFTVIDELANLAFAIEPASLAAVIELSAISTAATEQSTSAF